MTIDAHQHFWHYSPQTHEWINEEMQVIRRDFLPNDLAPVLRANGIDGCVAVQADQTDSESDFLLNLAAEHDFIKGVVGWTDLKSPELDQKLEAYKQNPLLKGFRHIVQGEPDGFMTDPAFITGISRLNGFDLSYDILVFSRQLYEVCQLIKQLPEMRLVMDHFGKPDIKAGEFNLWKKHMTELSAYPHLHVKLSGLVTEADWKHWKLSDFQPYIETILELFGPKRILFGSDWPVCLVAASYEQVLEIVNWYIEKLSMQEQAAVKGLNAVRFYGL
ncbi:MAG: amidohydrolase family protein [Cytophagia bacterium]|nr:amidohydrolase family protein [Cytophagia bacterium]